MLVRNPDQWTILSVVLLRKRQDVTMRQQCLCFPILQGYGVYKFGLFTYMLQLTNIHILIFPLAFSLNLLPDFHMGCILLEYSHSMVFVLYSLLLFFDTVYMLQYIFVSLGAYLGSRTVFVLLKTFGKDLGAWLEDCYGTCLRYLIQTFRILLMIGNVSIYHFLYVALI